MVEGLVNLDSTIDSADEPVGGEEADSAGQDPESEDNDEGVSKVQQCWDKLCDLQLRNTQKHALHTHAHTHRDSNLLMDHEKTGVPVIVRSTNDDHNHTAIDFAQFCFCSFFLRQEISPVLLHHTAASFHRPFPPLTLSKKFLLLSP